MTAQALPFETLIFGALGLACTGAGAGLLVLSRTGTRRERSRRFFELVRDESLADQRKWWLESWASGRRAGDAGVAEDEDVRLLAQAGWRRREALAGFVILRFALAGLGALAALVSAGLETGDVGAQTLILRSFIWGVVGFFAPKYLLRMKAKARLKRIDEEVGPLAEILCVLFDAGLSLEQCLRVILTHGGTIVHELRSELELALRQIAAGADRTDALRSATEDLGVEELSNMIRLLARIERHGGSVQQPLREFCRLLEDRRRTAMQERVSKLSAKMTMVMIVFLFPALLIFIGGPGFIALKRALEGARG